MWPGSCSWAQANGWSFAAAVISSMAGRWRQCPGLLDTLTLARRLLPGQASYRLGALTATLSLADGLPASLSPHRATYDALVTARLFVHLAASASESLAPAGDAGSGGGADAARLFQPDPGRFQRPAR